MSDQMSSILTDRTAFFSEAAFYATCLVRCGDPANLETISAYGKLIADKRKPERQMMAGFYRAFFNERKAGHMPEYERIQDALRDYPTRFGEFEDLIARGVYEMRQRVS